MSKAEDAYIKVARIVYVLGDMLSQGARDALADCLDIVWLHMSSEERKLANERLDSLGMETLHFDGDTQTRHISIGQTEDAMRVPFTLIANNKLGDRLGDVWQCTQCGEEHPVERGLDSDTAEPSRLLQFARCGYDTFLVGINGMAIK